MKIFNLMALFVAGAVLSGCKIVVSAEPPSSSQSKASSSDSGTGVSPTPTSTPSSTPTQPSASPSSSPAVSPTVSPTPPEQMGGCDPGSKQDGSEESPIQISDPDQFIEVFGKGEPGKAYILCSSLDFEGKDISSLPDFSGILDGNQQSIASLTINGPGLFRSLKEAKVMGLTLKGITVKPNRDGSAGILAGSGTDVDLLGNAIYDSNLVSGYKGALGSFLGHMANSSRPGTFQKNRVAKTLLRTRVKEQPIGGFIGILHAENKVMHVISNNSIQTTIDAVENTYCVGGMIGYASQGQIIENQVDTEFLSPGIYARAGGLLGCTQLGDGSTTIELRSNSVHFNELIGNWFGRVGGLIGAIETGNGSVKAVSNWIDGKVDAAHEETKGMLFGHLDQGSFGGDSNYWSLAGGDLKDYQSCFNDCNSIASGLQKDEAAMSGVPFPGGEWSDQNVWNFQKGAYPELLPVPK